MRVEAVGRCPRVAREDALSEDLLLMCVNKIAAEVDGEWRVTVVLVEMKVKFGISLRTRYTFVGGRRRLE